jgi:putative membrane protein
MMYGNNMATGGWIFSVLITLIIVALIVAAIAWAVSYYDDRSGNVLATNGSAREILQRRLANGELTVEQYEQLRKTLSEAATATPTADPPAPVGAHS